MLSQSCFLIKAILNPPSIIIRLIESKITSIPINPKSFGSINFANIIASNNCIILLPILSINDQIVPVTVFCLRLNCVFICYELTHIGNNFWLSIYSHCYL